MADKKIELSIVLRAVDAVTAKVKAINDQLDKATKPIRNFKEQLGKLREKSGLDDVIGGFKGVGSAIGDLLGKVAVAGGVLGGLGAALFHIIGEFDDLGDKAERFGVSVDFLAAMRNAAERAGAPLGALDEGLKSLNENLGQARAGTGRMAKFVGTVSTALLAQLKAAKSNEEAFFLLAKAMDKVKDPAKRAALAQKTLGDSALAPLLAKGSAGIEELRAEYEKLSGGSLQDAADKAGAFDDQMHRLHAATDGVKGAIVSGLAPALTDLIKQLTEWLSGHREDVRQWAADVGEKLPGAVHSVIDAVKDAVAWVRGFVTDIGGWKVAAGALAAVMAGPLISAIANLGIALTTTPFGRVVLVVSGLIALFKELKDHFGMLTAVAGTLGVALSGLFALGPIKSFIGQILGATRAMVGLGEASAAASAAGGAGGARGLLGKAGLIALPIAAASAISEATGGSVQDQARAKGWQGPDWDLAGAMKFLASGQDNRQSVSDSVAQSMQSINAARAQTAMAKVTVDFNNAPPGTRVRTDPGSTADVDLSVGWQTLVGAALP